MGGRSYYRQGETLGAKVKICAFGNPGNNMEVIAIKAEKTLESNGIGELRFDHYDQLGKL